jgi:hypothetical protein
MKILTAFLGLFFMLTLTKTTAQDTLKLCAVAVDNDNTVELQITVQEFTSIVSFQFAVAWDLNQYSFDSIGNQNEVLMQAGNLGFSNETANVPNDIELIRTLWLDNQVVGKDLDDGDVLFSVYLSNSSPGSSGFFGIVEDTYFPVEVIDGNFEEEDVQYEGDNCQSFRFGDLTSSISSLYSSKSFSIMGNPTDGILKVQADMGTINFLEVYSIEGKMLMKFENIPAYQSSFDLTGLKNGTYLISISSGPDNIMGTQKLIIQK